MPGHERFVRNMLAGAGGIDAVLLVVAADESVMPQTREHFDICRLLGIERGVIALTKSDLVDADTLELAALEVRELVAGSFLDGAPMIPVSARTGAGLDALRDGAGGARRRRRRGTARDGVVRLPVDRVFTVKGFGTVVTGTLVSGDVAGGDELVVLPDGRRGARARRAGARTQSVDATRAGAASRVNLGGVERRAIWRAASRWRRRIARGDAARRCAPRALAAARGRCGTARACACITARARSLGACRCARDARGATGDAWRAGAPPASSASSIAPGGERVRAPPPRAAGGAHAGRSAGAARVSRRR